MRTTAHLPLNLTKIFYRVVQKLSANPNPFTQLQQLQLEQTLQLYYICGIWKLLLKIRPKAKMTFLLLTRRVVRTHVTRRRV